MSFSHHGSRVVTAPAPPCPNGASRPRAGLYDPSHAKDSCGFGVVAQLSGEPSAGLARTALVSLGRMARRGAIAADGATGGVLLQRPDAFLAVGSARTRREEAG